MFKRACSHKNRDNDITSLSPTLSFTQEKTTVSEKNVFSVPYHLQDAQGSQTGSHGSQLTAQHAVVAAILAPKFAKNPPNGRNTGRPMKGPQIGSHGSQAIASHGLQAIGSQGVQATASHGLQLAGPQWTADNLAPKFAKNPPNGRNTGRPVKGLQIGSHGSQAIASHGLQAIGSQGVQATGSQGLQPFQTTERRPKMPASAVVVAANTIIAVNADNKSLCFIFNSPKNTVGEICWQRLPFLRYWGYRTKTVRTTLSYEKNPVITPEPIIGTRKPNVSCLLHTHHPLFVRSQNRRESMEHNSQKSNAPPSQRGTRSDTAA
jgi:hypothetical protein